MAESKFACYDIKSLRDALKNIDKKEYPELYDEIQNLIITKEFSRDNIAATRAAEKSTPVVPLSKQDVTAKKSNRRRSGGSGIYE